MRVCMLYVRRNVMHLNGKQYAKANGNNQSSVWWWRRNRISAQTPQSHLLHFIVSDARTDTHTHVTEHISDEMRPTTWNALCVRCSSNLSFCSNAFSTKCFNEEFPSWLLAITVGIVSLIAVSMLVFDVPFVGCPSGVHFSCVPYLVLQANCKYSKFYLQMNTSGGESTLVSLSNVAFKAETLRLLRGTFQIIRRHQCGPDFRIGGSKQDVWALRSELSWARRLLGRVCVCTVSNTGCLHFSGNKRAIHQIQGFCLCSLTMVAAETTCDKSDNTQFNGSSANSAVLNLDSNQSCNSYQSRARAHTRTSDNDNNCSHEWIAWAFIWQHVNFYRNLFWWILSFAISISKSTDSYTHTHTLWTRLDVMRLSSLMLLPEVIHLVIYWAIIHMRNNEMSSHK